MLWLASLIRARLFQHYRLYQHVFTYEQETLDLQETKTIEIPTVMPPPLSESVTLEAYEIELGKAPETNPEDVTEEENEVQEENEADKPGMFPQFKMTISRKSNRQSITGRSEANQCRNRIFII